MPRPDDFTPDMLAACDAELARIRALQREDPAAIPYRIPDALFDVPHFRETHYAGYWLDQKLTAVGCPRAQVRRICFANGQKCAMAADVWAPTLETLADYLAGSPPDEPGPALAARLYDEALRKGD